MDSVIQELLTELRQQQIKLTLSGENLEVTAVQNKIPAELIARIREHKPAIITYLQSVAVSADLSIPATAQMESYPLSSAQKRLWILSQFPGQSVVYNMPNTLVLNNSFDTECFVKAVKATIERHEILRTVFRQNDQGEVRQVVLPAGESGLSMQELDLSNQDNPQQAAAAFIQEDELRPFDLETGPLLRVVLIRISEDTHLFYYNMHHIVSDGWSINVLSSDIFAFYNAFLTGSEPQLEPLRIQYRDYAVWQNQQLEGDDSQRLEQFWLERFAGDLPYTELPFQLTRPTTKSSGGSSLSVAIPEATVTPMKQLANSNGASLFMVVLATLKTFIYRYTGETDVVLGTPVAGRNHPDLEGQIGFYVNMLALRNQLRPESSFATVVKEIALSTKEAFNHQEFPFDRLVEALNLPRDTWRNPLFSYSVTYHNHQEGGEEALLEGQVFSDRESTRFDMEFHFREVGHGLVMSVVYDNDLFLREDVSRMLEDYLLLTGSLLKQPDMAIARLDFLSDETRQLLLHTFNTTSTPYPSDLSIADLFRQQVSENPDKLALISGSKRFTYSELDGISNEIAQQLLSEYALAPGEIVAFQLDRNEWVMIAILAILKTGAAYLPIEPDAPVSRKEQMMKDASVRLLITEANYIFDLDFFDGSVFGIDVEYEPGVHPQEAPQVELSPRPLAYVMYTSGSTGTPKGVMVEQRSVVRLVKSSNMYTFTPDDTLLATGSLAFDATTFEFWGPLLNGGTLVLCEQSVLLNTSLLEQEIVKHGVSMMWFTSGWLNQLIESGTALFSHLNVVVAGGDRLSPAHLSRLLENYPDLKILNGYGPTENTTFSLYYPVQLPLTGEIPVGRPVSNSTVYILNEGNCLQPIGVPGEICLGGDGLSAGYLNDPSLTAQKFTADPHNPGQLIYRTGDKGKWLPEGAVAFLGRIDDQVKIRGYRIEPGEIEQVLLDHPAINNGVITLYRSSETDKELVAYYTSAEALNIPELRTYFKDRLPEYMVPTRFIRLEQLPLTVNGKVDKRALPAPDQTAQESGRAYVAPRTELEEKLVAVWQEVLKRERIGVQDDFFELGGHSLKLTVLLNEYHKQFQVKPTFSELFTLTTLEEHATLIENTATEDFNSIPQLPDSESYSISDAQRRLWVLSQFEDGSVAYNMPFSIVMQGQPDVEKLKKAIEQTLERHEILRTVFRQEETGEVRQHVKSLAALNFNVQVLDYSSHPDPEASATAFQEADAYQPFDLENGPLIRAAFLLLNDTTAVFYYNIHHIICDGWSLEILARDVFAIYESLRRGTVPVLPELRIQYRDYAAWQTAKLLEPEMDADRAYWLHHLSGDIPLLELPSAVNRPAVRTFNGSSLNTYLPKEAVVKLKALCEEKEATLFMGLLAVLKVLLFRYTAQNDIIIGSPIAGRAHADLKDQIGFYVNTLALRTAIDAEASYTETLEKVRETALNAYVHQHYPFDKLVEELGLNRDTSRNALFDIMLVLQNNGENSGTIEPDPSLVDLIEEGAAKTSKFDLLFNLMEQGDYISFGVEYNTDVYDGKLVKRFIADFKTLLGVLLNEPDQAIGKLNYLSGEEWTKVVTDFNATDVAYEETTVMDLFERQVLLTPDAIAVVSQDQEWTYTELNERANRLAHCLRNDWKVLPGNYVSVMLERSIESIIAMIGVMKSGACYVPVDPAYPEARINYLLSDTGAGIIIVSGRHPSHELLKDIQVLNMDTMDFTGYSASNPVQVNKPEDGSFVIYTSGSTGNPKGVEQTHRMMNNLICWDIYHSGIPSGLRHLQYASFSFDASLHDVYFVLGSGGSLYLAEDAVRLDFRLLREAIIDKQVEVLSFPYSALTNFFGLNKLNEFEGHSIRYIISTAEQLYVGNQLQSFLEKYSSIELHNHYGPSETHVVTAHKMSAAAGDLVNRSSIGIPISNTQIYILDSCLNPVPVGVIGELYIGGANLANGYLNLPETTEQRFIASPFDASAKLYTSGDLGYWTEEGLIEYIGRKDDQIKIHGYRIEPGEIEQAMLRYATLEDAVVVVKKKASGEQLLAAYFTASNETAIADLRNFLKAFLPEYMLPMAFVQLEYIPMTSNGKVDKKALPDPEHSGKTGRAAYEPPVFEDEKLLAGIWEDVLSRSPIGLRDDFFLSGGHSLSAIRLIYQVQKAFSVKIELKEVFHAPTVAEQIALIRSRETFLYTDIERAPEAAYYPLSHAQQRLWILSLFSPETSITYNLTDSFPLGQSLDVALLQKAFAALIDRHESLRTVFITVDGEPYQRILDTSESDFVLEHHPFDQATEAESFVGEKMNAFRSTPFDLENGPLMRAAIVELAQEGFHLLFSVHHIISDGVSLEVLKKDLTEIYLSLAAGATISLPPLNVQYKDYARWQNNLLTNGSMLQHRSFWLEQLQGPLPVMELPISDLRSNIRSNEGRRITIDLGSTISGAIRELALKENTTLFTVLLAGIKSLLFKYTGQTDVVIGVPYAGRDHMDLRNQIGFYINTLAMRTRFEETMSMQELVGAVNQTVMESLSHHSYPFDLLVEELNLKRDLTRKPVFDIYFNLLNHDDAGTEAGAGNEEEYQITSVFNKFDLDIHAREEGQTILLSVAGLVDLFSQENLIGFVNHFRQVLAEMVKNPGQSLKHLPLGAVSEDLTQGKPFVRDEETCMHELFEKQRTKTPDKTALVYNDQSLSYAQLGLWSDQLAGQLRVRYKIAAGDRVGLLLDNSDQLIVGLLAILKAGGVFVSLDKNDPQQRLNDIVTDASVQCILTDDASISFEGVEVCTVPLLSDDEAIAALPEINAAPESSAYISYTSGSTGIPKGVEVTHTAFVNAIKGLLEEFDFNGDWNYLLNSRLSFDPSLRQIFIPLSIGGTLIIPPDLRDIQQVAELVSTWPINALYATPPVWDALLSFPDFNPDQLFRAMSSGSQLPATTAEKIKALIHPEGKVINMYGPTEVCMVCSYIELQTFDTKPVIGKPARGYQVYIVDSEMNLLPEGIPGEIIVSSRNLAVGYVNKPELTAEKFVANPFGEGRVYKTGDLGCWDHSGNMVYLGRNDDQVKISGYRIECGEIEHQLRKRADVREAVVLAKGADDQKHLVAYVVTADSGLDAQTLRDGLKEQLPDYMVPAAFVLLDQLPLTANGKTDRRALLDMQHEKLTGSVYTLPETETESRLVELWEELLASEKIGTTDNFFDLGGNSIKATKLISTYMKQFNVKLNLKDLFVHPTIKGHAHLIDLNQWIESDSLATDNTENETFNF